MRLDLDFIRIQDVRFGPQTAVRDSVLYLNAEELKDLLLQDRRFSSVEIELAHPGDKCRIVQCVDVIEPRAKTDGGPDFPGVVGPIATAGSGRTCVLEGTAVVMSDYREVREGTTSNDPNGEIIDMAGPAAELGIYGQTHNIVLLPLPTPGTSTLDYLGALKVAGIKAAAYLGRAGKGVAPDRTETYELPPLSHLADGKNGLPRVAYIFQIYTQQFDPIPGDPILYGAQVDGIAPTLLHPNEVLDGALTSQLPALNVQTYHIQNHAMVRELYRRHGKDLWFSGVIVMTAPNNVPDIERASCLAAGLAKHQLGVDAVVLTKTGGGAPELTMARTAQRCEQLGIRTVIAMLHMGADIKDAKHGATTIFSMPEVDAIVSMGIPFMELNLPAVERIVGRPGPGIDAAYIQGEMTRIIRWIKGSQCQLGSGRLKAVRY
jgi:glycine reductase